MSDHSENAIHAAVKALSQVVAPAVDRANPLAVEQLRLVITFLEFHVRAVPQARRLQWMELHLQLEMCRKVADLLDAERLPLGAALRATLEDGLRALARTGAPASLWQEAAARVAAAVSGAVDAVSAERSALRRRLDVLVVEESRRMLDLKRVWFKPYGFEARPDSLPALQDVLRGAPDV